MSAHYGRKHWVYMRAQAHTELHTLSNTVSMSLCFHVSA